MNFKDLNWNLTMVSDSNVLDKDIKEAAKTASYALGEVRNLLGLDASVSVDDLVKAVYEMKEKSEQPKLEYTPLAGSEKAIQAVIQRHRDSL